MEQDAQSNDSQPLAVPLATYYNIPIELIIEIHGMCEPEEFGEFRIADARLHHGPLCSVPHSEVDADYFEAYKQRQLVTVAEEASIFEYKRTYTTFRGKPHGEFKSWRHNGQLYRHAFYAHGKLHGEHREWFTTGRLSYRAFHVHGKYKGKFKRWHSNGQLYTRAFYVHGKCEGDYQQWHENGQLHSVVFNVHSNREGEYQQWYENGNLQSRSFYVNDLLNGEYNYWNIDGYLAFSCIYINGVEIMN